MGISCSCDYFPEPGNIAWQPCEDFQPLRANRRQRCKSCGKLIEIGADCLKFIRWKIPDTDFEVRIYGEDGEIPRATHYLCEECGGIWLSLDELGVCPEYDSNQRENVAELNRLVEAEKKAVRKHFGL